jgi:glycosyltransferase involved in cell wall biosynthesis
MTRQPPFVSVVVPVLDGAATIGDCLRSVLATNYPDQQREIVVVDNGSVDETAEIVSRFPVRCVEEATRGPSHARNAGIRASRGEIVAFTDADCVVSTDWLRELVASMTNATAAVGGEIVAWPPVTPAERYVALRRASYLDWSARQRRPWAPAMNLALRRETLDRVGTFDPRFGVGCEDIEFGWRIADAGLELRFNRRAMVFHRHRTNARALFRQQLGYGHGQATLAGLYPEVLQWTWRAETAAWVDLVRAGAAAVRELVLDPRARTSVYDRYDFVRKLGQRLGFSWGQLRASRRLERSA